MESTWNTFTTMFLSGCREQKLPPEILNHLTEQLDIEAGSLRSQGIDIDRLPPSQVQSRLMAVLNNSLRQTPESWCGEGSFVANTGEVREFLEDVLRRRRILTMADIACGDWNWMRRVNLGDTLYTGFDIDPKFIEANRLSFRSYVFEVADALTMVMPSVDLLLCRDLMIHMSNDDIVRLLGRMRRSGSRYLMATSYDYLDHNEDFTEAQKSRPYSHERRHSRKINLQLPPFDLPAPVEFVRENDTPACQRRIVGLWEL